MSAEDSGSCIPGMYSMSGPAVLNSDNIIIIKKVFFAEKSTVSERWVVYKRYFCISSEESCAILSSGSQCTTMMCYISINVYI
jgi:hypothetical protein